MALRIILEIPGSGRQLMKPAQQILQAMAEAYGEEFKVRPLPPLYSTQIHFRPEPWAGLGTEEWASPYDVFERGWGDCDDLSLFRCAQLIAEGEPATIVEAWLRGTKRHHFLVRRANGQLEDPSKNIVAAGRRLK